MAAGWAVLRCQPRREPIAARAVNARGLETYIPTLPGRSPASHTLLFPGYLFAHIEEDRDDLLRIRAAPGVAYLLPRAAAPALLPDAVIQAMRSQEAVLAGAVSGESFSRGDMVRVRSGPFKWVRGLFDRRLSAPGRVRILLDLVHGTATVDINDVDLEPVGGLSQIHSRIV